MIRRLDVKIVAILLVTVLVPLGVSLFLVLKIIDASMGLGINDDLASQLKQAVDVHRRFIKESKLGFQRTLLHLVDSYRIHNTALYGSDADLEKVLNEEVNRCPYLKAIRLYDADGHMRSEASRVNTDADLRIVILEEEVSFGVISRVEALFEVSNQTLNDYKRAGEMQATYQALLEAPSNYLKNRFVTVYLAILGLAVILTSASGIVIARRLIRRIHELGNATSRVGEGDLSVRVQSGAKDEVGELVESFNAMVSELSVNRARIEYLQKISAWQEMARRLAHEIKNPLTPIQLAAQQLKEKYDGDDPKFGFLLSQSTEIIKEEVETLRRLTSDFAAFAKLPAVRTEEINLAEFLGECEASLQSVISQRGVELVFEKCEPSLKVMVDRIMMKRVIDNLVRNATDAILGAKVDKPKIVVGSKRIKSRKKLEAEIRVVDNGPGVTPENQCSIFDPYFTTKSEGTGLGLAISKKIVLEHGGRIWLDENHSEGAAFILLLPALS